jgi:ketosteroid isomerase-like protein
MKKSILAAFVAAAALYTTGCTPPAPKGPTDAELIAMADSLDHAFVEAYNKGDADAIMALYWNSPDATVYPPGDMVIKGHEAIRNFFVDGFSKESGATLELNSSENKVFGGAVLGQGLWTWTMPVPGGEPVSGQGRYTDLKVVVDGKMVYVTDHASVPMPPMPPMPGDTAAAAPAPAN